MKKEQVVGMMLTLSIKNSILYAGVLGLCKYSGGTY